jgi:hypothetical protein
VEHGDRVGDVLARERRAGVPRARLEHSVLRQKMSSLNHLEHSNGYEHFALSLENGRDKWGKIMNLEEKSR